MLLRFLGVLGRSRVILDRGPSHPHYDQAKPWLRRHYLLFRRRPQWFPFNVFVHEMLDDDHGEGVHNHRCPYVTIILRQGYWETLADGRHWRGPGYVGFRAADTLHRVDLEPGTRPLTLFIAGPFGLRRRPRAVYGQRFNTEIGV